MLGSLRRRELLPLADGYILGKPPLKMIGKPFAVNSAIRSTPYSVMLLSFVMTRALYLGPSGPRTLSRTVACGKAKLTGVGYAHDQPKEVRILRKFPPREKKLTIFEQVI